MDKNLANIVKKGIMITGVFIVAELSHVTYDLKKEERIDESFQKTPAFLELNANYQSQRMAIDTPYTRQRAAIENAYHLQVDSLKKLYLKNSKKSGGE